MVKVFLDNFSNFLAFREKASTFLCLCGGSESNLVFTENCGIFDDIVKMVITTKIIQNPLPVLLVACYSNFWHLLRE